MYVSRVEQSGPLCQIPGVRTSNYIETAVFVVIFEMFPSEPMIAEAKRALNLVCFRITSEAEDTDMADCFLRFS